MWSVCVHEWLSVCECDCEQVHICSCVYMRVWVCISVLWVWVCMYVVEGVALISFILRKMNINISWEHFSKESWHFCLETHPSYSILEGKHGFPLARCISCYSITCCSKTRDSSISKGRWVTEGVGLLSARDGGNTWTSSAVYKSTHTSFFWAHGFLLYYRRKKEKATYSPSSK